MIEERLKGNGKIMIKLKDILTEFRSGLRRTTGNVAYIEKPIRFTSMQFNSISSSQNNWPSSSWNKGYDKIDGVEFMFKSPRTKHNQHLLVATSSTDTTKKKWDLRLVKSGSHPTRGKIEFRLSATFTGSTSLGSNAVSMSTNFIKVSD